MSTDLHLGFVVRVGELRVQYESEVRVVFDLLVAHFDGATLLDGVSTNNWVKNWVDGLLDVFDEDNLAH